MTSRRWWPLVLLLPLLAAHHVDADETAARQRLLDEFTPPVRAPDVATPEVGPELALQPIRLRVLDANGAAVPAIAARAWQSRFDITSEGETDADGIVELSLPRGMWRIDLSGRHGDDVVFDRVRFDIQAEGVREVSLVARRTISVRTRSGSLRPADRLVLATDDLVHQYSLEGVAGPVRVLSQGEDPFICQASAAPGKRAGFLIRGRAAAGDTRLLVDGPDAVPHAFRGSSSYVLTVSLDTVDRLASPLDFNAARLSRVLVAGVKQVSVGYGVKRGDLTYRFHPSALDVGTKRTFEGRPPFTVSASYFLNSNSRFRGMRGTSSFRVFLREENGLVVRGAGRAPFPIQWRATLKGGLLTQGSMTGSWRSRLPQMSDAEREDLRLELQVTGGGRKYKRTVTPARSVDLAQVGVLRVHSLPELEANAQSWAIWCGQLVDAFYESTHVRPPDLGLYLWVEAMPGLSGWGGWNNRRSYAYFADGRLFGFVRAPARNDGTVSHELGHSFHEGGHGASFQALQSRAVRRMKSLRNDAHRIPAGNAYRATLTSPPHRPAQTAAAKSPPPGAVAGVDTQVLEDEMVAWYVRSMAGADACVQWRATWWQHRWALTLEGFHDDVIRAAHAALYADHDCAWLLRLRGGSVPRAPYERALAFLRASPALTNRGGRRNVIRAWQRRGPPEQSAWPTAYESMRAELGDRGVRAQVLAGWVTDMADTPAGLRLEIAQAALAEAWAYEPATFETTLATLAKALAE